MSNEELHQARLDRLLEAITNKEILIESLQKKIPKQLTIEELREQFEEYYKKEYVVKQKYLSRFLDYKDDFVNQQWIGYLECARANKILKDGE